MILRISQIISAFIFLLCSNISVAQKAPPFWNEIQKFKKEDSINFPGKNKILFTGSSSIRLWTDIDQYFTGYQIINRGFGGSTLEDLIRYVPDLIYPYDPKQIFLYSGENDLASNDSITPQVVLDRFKTVFSLIREKYKKVQILYISIKPSPSRRRLMAKIVEANKMIRIFLKKKSHAKFIDIYPKMLKEDGTVLTDIWKPDSLHMTAKGYAIWQKVLEPYLKK